MEHMASHLLHFRPDRRQAGRQGPFLERCAPAFSGLYIVFSFVSSIHGPSAPTARMGGGRRAWQHRTRIDTGGGGLADHGIWVGVASGRGGARTMSRMVWGGKGRADRGGGSAVHVHHVMSGHGNGLFVGGGGGVGSGGSGASGASLFLLCSHGPPSLWGSRGSRPQPPAPGRPGVTRRQRMKKKKKKKMQKPFAVPK